MSANNLLKFLHPIHQQQSLISIQLRGLICRKIKIACFPTPGTAPKTRTFVVIFFFFARKLFLKHSSQFQKTSIPSDPQAALSLFIIEQVFPCPCQIVILGNVSITAKWSAVHSLFHTFFISVEPPGPTGKICCPLASLEVKSCQIHLNSRCWNHLQNGQRGVFTVGLKSHLWFFQKIASTHHTNLMMLAWGLLKWKMARHL